MNNPKLSTYCPKCKGHVNYPHECKPDMICEFCETAIRIGEPHVQDDKYGHGYVHEFCEEEFLSKADKWDEALHDLAPYING